MLRLNLREIMKIRGIERPYSFIVKIGISPNIATRMANDKPVHISLKHMELLCMHLNCEPNDLFVWTPDNNTSLSEHHALQRIRKEELPLVQEKMKELSYRDLKELMKKMEAESKSNEM